MSAYIRIGGTMWEGIVYLVYETYNGLNDTNSSVE